MESLQTALKILPFFREQTLPEALYAADVSPCLAYFEELRPPTDNNLCAVSLFSAHCAYPNANFRALSRNGRWFARKVWRAICVVSPMAIVPDRAT